MTTTWCAPRSARRWATSPRSTAPSRCGSRLPCPDPPVRAHPHPHPKTLPSHRPQADSTRWWKIYTHALPTYSGVAVLWLYVLTMYRCGRISTSTFASLTSPRSVVACTAACRAIARCSRWATLTLAVLTMAVLTMAACWASRRGSSDGGD